MPHLCWEMGLAVDKPWQLLILVAISGVFLSRRSVWMRARGGGRTREDKNNNIIIIVLLLYYYIIIIICYYCYC